MEQTLTSGDSSWSSMDISKIMNVLDSASMGIWRLTMREGKKTCLSASPKMLELLGLPRDCNKSPEELYEVWHEGVSPEEVEKVSNYFQKMMNGEKCEVTYKWINPRLGVRYIRCGGNGCRNVDGCQILEGYHYDVTDLMSQHMQDTLVVKSFANTYSSLFYVDIEKDWYTSYIYNLPYIGDVFPKTGSVKENMPKFVSTLCQECDRERMIAFTDLSTLNSRLHNRNSISIQYRGTKIEWVELSFVVCDRNKDGDVTHMVVSVKDITAEKQEEMNRLAELKENVEANKAKTMMLQNMTHEIRTPLNALYGFSQLLCMPDGSYSEEEKMEYYDYIYNSFNMLSMIIDDVMDLTDVEHGNYRMQITRFAVNRACRDAVQMAELRKRGPVKMYFTTEVDDDYMIESDSRRIQQILVNLLGNACKHTIEGEIHLHLSSTETPGRLTFSVTDTGEGIPADKAKDIFKRYMKANNLVQGSGLGLHISCTIANKLGAEIKLDESYTDGARFLLIL